MVDFECLVCRIHANCISIANHDEQVIAENSFAAGLLCGVSFTLNRNQTLTLCERHKEQLRTTIKTAIQSKG